MNVDLIFKIAAVGIIVAVLNQLLIRSGREAVSYTHLCAHPGIWRAILKFSEEISRREAIFPSCKTAVPPTPTRCPPRSVM